MLLLAARQSLCVAVMAMVVMMRREWWIPETRVPAPFMEQIPGDTEAIFILVKVIGKVKIDAFEGILYGERLAV